MSKTGSYPTDQKFIKITDQIMSNNDFAELDQLMGYESNPFQIFPSTTTEVTVDDVYRTSPKDSKSEDGHYHAKVRLLYNVYNRARTIVHSAVYNLRDDDGWFNVTSLLGENDPASPFFRNFKDCPLFKAWKRLHFSDDPKKQEIADKYFTKDEKDWIMVQVIEDKNRPDLVGKFLPWKLPRAVAQKLQAKVEPSKESGRVPVNVLDLLMGRVLDIDVVPGPNDKAQPDRYYRETKYDLCEFDTEVFPIIKTDGTALFTEAEVETIEKYDKKLTAIAKMKTPEEQQNAYGLLKANALYTQVREMMQKAYEYVKDNCKDLVEVKGYQPWSEDLTARVNAYIKRVSEPKTDDTAAPKETPAVTPVKAEPVAPAAAPSLDDDLPF